MNYLLDTSACVHLLNGASARLADRARREGPSRLAVSSLTVAELCFGAERSGRPRSNRERLRVFLAELVTETFDDDCAQIFGTVKAALLAAGTPIADFDIAIAATALATDRVLVSTDGDFRHVPDLLAEDWTRSTGRS